MAKDLAHSPETELKALEDAFCAAIVKNDADAIGRFLAPDWIIIDPNGEIVDRSRFLSVVQSGALKHETMQSEDVRVRVHDNVAIVAALTSTKGNFMGQPFSTKERATDVFVRRGQHWECIFSQLTSYKEKHG